MGNALETISEEERRAVEVHKWYLSQRVGADVGWDAAYEDWKKYYQAEWRERERLKHREDLAEQVVLIKEYAWHRSEEAGRDLSRPAEEEWVRLYAAEWRDQAAQKSRRVSEEGESLKLELEGAVYGTPMRAEWRKVTIRNEKGLHVRPSMMLKKLLDSHSDCEVYVQNMAVGGGAIRIREMTHILSLGAICGDQLLFGVTGGQALLILDEIESLFERRFNDCC